jgi:hypothetical protein
MAPAKPASQLATGVAQPLGQHVELVLESCFMGTLEAQALVGQKLQGQGAAAHQQSHKHQAQQQTAAEYGKREMGKLERLQRAHRNPRMGTFSMPSKAGPSWPLSCACCGSKAAALAWLRR